MEKKESCERPAAQSGPAGLHGGEYGARRGRGWSHPAQLHPRRSHLQRLRGEEHRNCSESAKIVCFDFADPDLSVPILKNSAARKNFFSHVSVADLHQFDADPDPACH